MLFDGECPTLRPFDKLRVTPSALRSFMLRVTTLRTSALYSFPNKQSITSRLLNMQFILRCFYNGSNTVRSVCFVIPPKVFFSTFVCNLIASFHFAYSKNAAA